MTKQIYKLCLTNIDFSNSISMFTIISNSFFKYFSNNKYVILDGFVNFKIPSYIKELDCIVDMCVNKFILDREYNEFISLLRAYIQTTPSNSECIHLIYTNNESILLDSDKNVIQFNKNLLNQKYLSDITFSSFLTIEYPLLSVFIGFKTSNLLIICSKFCILYLYIISGLVRT